MRRFFVGKYNILKDLIVIQGSDATHITTVLRLHAGDDIQVCDGEGLLYLVRLEEIKNRSVKGKIISSEKIDTESPLKIHLGQSLIKGNKFDGNNYMINNGEAYGPESWEWLYMGDISTPMQGGAFRLPNGNTIITQTHTATVIEVNSEGNELWSFTHEGESSYWIARCEKYSPDYLGNLLLGDMNGDGSLNILDVVILANLILAGDTSNPSCDLNQDGSQNILDIVILINLILYS